MNDVVFYVIVILVYVFVVYFVTNKDEWANHG